MLQPDERSTRVLARSQAWAERPGPVTMSDPEGVCALTGQLPSSYHPAIIQLSSSYQSAPIQLPSSSLQLQPGIRCERCNYHPATIQLPTSYHPATSQLPSSCRRSDRTNTHLCAAPWVVPHAACSSHTKNIQSGPFNKWSPPSPYTNIHTRSHTPSAQPRPQTHTCTWIHSRGLNVSSFSSAASSHKHSQSGPGCTSSNASAQSTLLSSSGVHTTRPQPRRRVAESLGLVAELS